MQNTIKQEKKEDLRIKRTKNLLVKALFELLAEKSIDKISVLDICDRAAVHRTTFYKHYEDKYDLLTYSLNKWQEEILPESILSMDFESAKLFSLHIMTNIIENIDSKKDLFLRILTNNQYTVMPRLIINALGDRLRFLADNTNLIQNEVPVEITAMFFSGGFSSLIIWWLSNKETATKEQLIAYIRKIIMKSFLLPD